MLRDDLISSSLSIGPGAGSISRIDASIWRFHFYAPSVHQWAQESSTTLHFFSGQLARFRDAHVESSNPSLFGDRTGSISKSWNTLFRQLCFCCGVRTHAELVDVVHHTLEGPTPIWCLRRLALCEIWPASLKVPRPSPSTTKSCSRKALWACIDVFVRFSPTDEVASPKLLHKV